MKFPSQGATPLLLASVFVILVTVAIASLEGWLGWRERSQQLQEAEVSASNLAKSLAQHAEDAIEQSDIVLAGLVEQVATDGVGEARLERLHRVMAARVASMRQLRGLFLYDAEGRWLVTSNPGPPPALNNADREYFQYHRDHPGAQVHIGPPIRSRSSGDWIIPVSRRLDNPDGSFAGVALATLRLDYFVDYYKGFDLDEQGAVLLATGDGTILVRQPDSGVYTGSSVAQGKVFAYLTQQSAGTAMVESMFDHVTRLVAYRHVDRYPLIVTAALSRDSILAPWYEGMRRSSFIVALVLLATVSFGVALIRQIRRGEQAEQALRAAHDELEKLAMLDGLTGLSNRRRFDETLPLELNRARRTHTPVGLIMADIDHFKRYNDLYGHPAGDDCLVAVANAIQCSIRRPGDLAVRYGGEEIAVLLPGTHMSGALQVAQQILEAVRALGIPHSGSEAGVVTLSIGVHVCQPGDGASPRQLISRADEALYSAKTNGRNQIRPAILADELALRG